MVHVLKYVCSIVSCSALFASEEFKATCNPLGLLAAPSVSVRCLGWVLLGCSCARARTGGDALHWSVQTRHTHLLAHQRALPLGRMERTCGGPCGENSGSLRGLFGGLGDLGRVVVFLWTESEMFGKGGQKKLRSYSRLIIFV